MTGPALVAAAALYATYAHRHQRRKTSGYPYIVHPARVALRIWRCGHRAPEVLAAALLHDVTEDTDCPVSAPPWPERVVTLMTTLVLSPNSAGGAPLMTSTDCTESRGTWLEKTLLC